MTLISTSSCRGPSPSRERTTAGYLLQLTREIKSGDIWVGWGQEEENTSADRRLRLGCKISMLWNSGEQRTTGRASTLGREPSPTNWEGLEEKPLGAKHMAAWKNIPAHFNSANLY